MTLHDLIEMPFGTRRVEKVLQDCAPNAVTRSTLMQLCDLQAFEVDKVCAYLGNKVLVKKNETPYTFSYQWIGEKPPAASETDEEPEFFHQATFRMRDGTTVSRQIEGSADEGVKHLHGALRSGAAWLCVADVEGGWTLISTADVASVRVADVETKK